MDFFLLSSDKNSMNDSDFDYSIESFDSDLNSDDSYLCNAMVIIGPHGIGKTAMVYAVASELGFKVVLHVFCYELRLLAFSRKRC